MPPTNNHLIILVNGLDLPSNLRLSCFIFHLSSLLKNLPIKLSFSCSFSFRALAALNALVLSVPIFLPIAFILPTKP